VKNVLVIGGYGVIGSELVLALMKLGYYVMVVDNLSNNVTQVKCNQFLKEDIENLDFTSLNKIPDIVFHLASESRPTYFESKYKDIVNTNVNGTMKLIEFLENENPNCKVFYASSSEVYGYNDNLLFENDNLVTNTNYKRNIYSISKMLSESLLINSKLDWIILRFFNVYSPMFRNDDNKIIPVIIKSIRNKSSIPIFGNGNRTRTFTSIKDVIYIILLILNNFDKTKKQIFNVSSNETLTINEVIQIAEKIAKTKIRKTYHKEREGEPVNRKPDITKIKNLGYNQIQSISDFFSEVF